MKKKKVIALLLSAAVIAAVPAPLANNMVVLAEDLETNTGSLEENTGTINNNSGTITENKAEGTVVENTGTITTNSGTITTNSGTVTENKAVEDKQGSGIITTNKNKVETNNGFITENATGATVKTNNVNIDTNRGTVEDNSDGYIKDNYGTVKENTGIIFNNYGTVEDNKKIVAENRAEGTVIFNNPYNSNVGENYGKVIINIDVDDPEFIEHASEWVVGQNYNQVDVNYTLNQEKKTDTFYGVSGYNGKEAEEYLRLVLGSIKKDEIFTLSIPAANDYYEYGVDGVIKLSKDNKTLEYLGDKDSLQKDGDYYIVPLGARFKVTGSAEFIANWYRKLIKKGVSVVVDEAISNVVAPEKPAPQMSSSSVPGVEINNWDDVSNVISTKADAIAAEPNSDTKLLKLELRKEQMEIPKTVVSDLATSSVDGLHCFIGNGTAITFVDNGTLDNYIPTDFTHTDKETDTMKFIDFTAPQEIGATVFLSTRVPVKNAPVAIWMLVDGQYKLVGSFITNELGNVAFPISSTGNFVITY